MSSSSFFKQSSHIKSPVSIPTVSQFSRSPQSLCEMSEMSLHRGHFVVICLHIYKNGGVCAVATNIHHVFFFLFHTSSPLVAPLRLNNMGHFLSIDRTACVQISVQIRTTLTTWSERLVVSHCAIQMAQCFIPTNSLPQPTPYCVSYYEAQHRLP